VRNRSILIRFFFVLFFCLVVVTFCFLLCFFFFVVVQIRILNRYRDVTGDSATCKFMIDLCLVLIAFTSEGCFTGLLILYGTPENPD
jgi:hypothetical protein